MKLLIAPTEDFNRDQRTELAAPAGAGSSVNMQVADSKGFAAGNYIVVGTEGSQQAELCIVSAVPDATHLTVTTLLLNHLTDESITKYFYNARKFYGSATSGGSYTELVSSGSPVTIGVNNPQGTVLEYTGTDGFLYFKSTYFNTSTSDESDITESDPVLADDSSRYTSLYSIRVKAGLTENPFISDQRIEEKRKQAENEVNSYIMSRYALPLANSTGVPEVPWLIQNVTTLLAAGYLDYEEFLGDGMGVKWLGEARGILKALQQGTQRLIGTDSAEMTAVTSTQGIQGPSSGSCDYPPSFTMRQRF